MKMIKSYFKWLKTNFIKVINPFNGAGVRFMRQQATQYSEVKDQKSRAFEECRGDFMEAAKIWAEKSNCTVETYIKDRTIETAIMAFIFGLATFGFLGMAANVSLQFFQDESFITSFNLTYMMFFLLLGTVSFSYLFKHSFRNWQFRNCVLAGVPEFLESPVKDWLPSSKISVKL